MISFRGGEEIGPYQVLQFLGRGSFGVVLLAEDPRHPLQRFALKLVPCDHLDSHAAARAKDAALAEAEVLRRLRHPHVVTCHDVSWDSERHVVWLALDFMGGGDLQSLVDGRRRAGEPPPEAPFIRRVIAAVGSALRYIHSQGVLHRDVKSSNVLLSREPLGGGPSEIKLADFGISKILEVTGQALTVVGTPPYMSPELVRGEPYGAASDAWALGVLLYELAGLRRPFEAGNQLALVCQIVEQQPAPLPVGTAPDISRAIAGLLDKDPQQRLRLAEALALSPVGRGTVLLPPPPPFPPPPSPRSRIVDPSAAAHRELVRQASEWSTVSEEELGTTVPEVPVQVSGRSEETLGLGLRPALAFSEPQGAAQAASKAKEKERSTGRRWLPRFGLSLRGSSSKPHGEESTIISAFDPESGAEEEDPPAVSPATKWTGSFLSLPPPRV